MRWSSIGGCDTNISAAFRPALISFLLFLSGCASAGWLGDPRSPYPPPRPAQVGDIFHLPTGIFVDQNRMLQAATDARVVFVGETHDNPASHRLELQILRALADRYPGQVAVGMETFTPRQQPALDRWVSGELSEKAFLKESRWYDVWSLDFDYYKPLLLFARERKIPVIGLNADKDLQNAARRQDVSRLSEESRRQLSELDLEQHLGDPYRRALVESVYDVHLKGEADLAGFLRVQTLWDELMGANAARYLAGPEGKDRRLMVVAGGNHVRHGFGIPRALFRRFPASYVLIGTEEIVIPPEKRRQLLNVPTSKYPMPAYDFVVYTEYEDLGKRPVRMGVALKETDGKVVVGGVTPGSVAAAAGLKEGDRLVSFDGEPVNDTFDVVYPLRQKSPGQTARLVVERNGRTLELTLSFRSEEGEKDSPQRK